MNDAGSRFQVKFFSVVVPHSPCRRCYTCTQSYSWPRSAPALTFPTLVGMAAMAAMVAMAAAAAVAVAAAVATAAVAVATAGVAAATAAVPAAPAATAASAPVDATVVRAVAAQVHGGMAYGTPISGGTYVASQPAPTSGPATIVVTLPADARLNFDGSPTRTTSARRVFTSPPLQPGQSYQYTLTAEISREGRPVTVTQRGQRACGPDVPGFLELPHCGGDCQSLVPVDPAGVPAGRADLVSAISLSGVCSEGRTTAVLPLVFTPSSLWGRDTRNKRQVVHTRRTVAVCRLFPCIRLLLSRLPSLRTGVRFRRRRWHGDRTHGVQQQFDRWPVGRLGTAVGVAQAACSIKNEVAAQLQDVLACTHLLRAPAA